MCNDIGDQWLDFFKIDINISRKNLNVRKKRLNFDSDQIHFVYITIIFLNIYLK